MKHAPTQSWNAAAYETNASFVSELASEVVAWLNPQPGERILDVGCGDGTLAQQLLQRGVEVVGVDPSEPLLEAARSRGVDARLGDAQTLPFEAEFDAVFTNAVLHWVPDLKKAVHAARRALRPGGRFVGEFGGHGNVAAVCTALRSVAQRHGVSLKMPWTYPTVKEFGALLSGAGFEVQQIVLAPRPTPLPTGMEGWLRTFAGPLLAQLPKEAQQSGFDEVVECLRWSLCDSEARWTADYVRLRFVATLP
jgi:ubiquinone/menaquinone biosynthesis C-methylase UbiE